MSNESQKQEIVITDIHMQFSSMVMFMVKWAIASIPALIILMFLAAFLWAGAVALVTSVGSIGRNVVSAPSASVASTEASQVDTAEVTYLDKIIVRNTTVGNSELGQIGVFGEIKNTGDRTLKEVGITILCLGADGKPVFEKKYTPVLVTGESFLVGDNEPLKPGYSKQFGVRLDDAPSDWTKKVDVKVSTVKFQ